MCSNLIKNNSLQRFKILIFVIIYVIYSNICIFLYITVKNITIIIVKRLTYMLNFSGLPISLIRDQIKIKGVLFYMVYIIKKSIFADNYQYCYTYYGAIDIIYYSSCIQLNDDQGRSHTLIDVRISRL